MADDLPNSQTGDARKMIARRYCENAESWLRKLVHAELHRRDGPTYITDGAWNNKIKKQVAANIKENRNKYSREVDATTFGQLVDMVCNPEHWPKWKDALRDLYPHGAAEARTFLCRLQSIRNDVSHGQLCSARQLEQAICYSNDLADSIKAYFRRIGLSREFDVPTFVRCYDNQGNSEDLIPGHHFRTVNFSMDGRRLLYPGEILVAEVEVDPSFEAVDYDVIWWVKTAVEKGHGTVAKIRIENRHVGDRMELQFKLTTKREWHRGNRYDDALDIFYKVLPH